MPKQRQPRRPWQAWPFGRAHCERDKDWLAIVRQQPCCVCGDNVSVEAHHPRVGSISDGKPSTGMAEKASDKWAVALCGRHHRELHAKGERLFWAELGIDPFAVAMNYGRPEI